MKWKLLFVGLASVLVVCVGRAQDQTPSLPKGQMPDLGRPTKVGDELPAFNFDQFGNDLQHGKPFREKMKNVNQKADKSTT